MISISISINKGGVAKRLKAIEGDPNYTQESEASRGQGDAVVHISANALSSIDLKLPALDEQIAIAGILTDMDAEIEAAEFKLAKARKIKQGMMQELLTGRIRLI